MYVRVCTLYFPTMNEAYIKCIVTSEIEKLLQISILITAAKRTAKLESISYKQLL